MFHPGMQKDTCNFLSENTFMTALLAFNLSTVYIQFPLSIIQ